MAPYYLSIPPILGLQCPSKTIYTAFCEFAPPPSRTKPRGIGLEDNNKTSFDTRLMETPGGSILAIFHPSWGSSGGLNLHDEHIEPNLWILLLSSLYLMWGGVALI
jgi:hypothetical protein